MADEVLFNFTEAQFNDLMKNQGLNKTARLIVDLGNQKLGGNVMTYESMLDGTAPILDLLPSYAGIAPEDRKLTDEAILSLLTNADDQGKYDPGSTGEGAATRQALTSFARAAPEAAGAGIGFSYGVRAAAPLANMIPPAGLPGLAAKGVVYLGGGLTTALFGSWLAGEAEDAVIGEKAPVLPSLKAADNFGESLMFGISMLHAPWSLAGKAKNANNAVDFLDNFRNVASGKFVANADDAIEITARNAGLSEKAYKAAIAAREAAGKGAMFSKPGTSAGGINLGLTRFNPSGKLFDPTKGPLGSRIAAGVEGGIQSGLKAGREKPFRFALIESAAALGGATGAMAAQANDPYDDGKRFLLELGGSALVPIPAQLFIDKGPEVIKGIGSKAAQWYGKDVTAEGLMAGRVKREAGERLMAALKESSEYEGPQQMEAFIEGLLKQSFDENGEPLKDVGLVEDLARAFGLPYSDTLRSIGEKLTKANQELAVATSRGRDQMLVAARQVIHDLNITGDPNAMAVAARMEQGIFEQHIIDEMEKGINRLYASADKVLGASADAGSQQVDLSRQLYSVLENQLQASKRVEKSFWDQVGNYPITSFTARNGREMSQPNLLVLLDKPSSQGGLKMASTGAQSKLNSALKGYMADIDDFRDYFQNGGGGKNPVTAQRLYEMRSGVQDIAANLRANGQNQMARNMDMIADAVLRDLTGQKSSDNAAYNAARAYSYARNNVFNRSFIGEMTVRGKDRALTMNPDALAAAFLQGNNRATMERINEIDAAGRFGMEHFLDDALLNRTSTMETMDLVIRDSLRQVMDKKPVLDPVTKAPVLDADGNPRMTWVVNQSKLDNWRKQPGTQELFAVFPQLAKDLASAEDAANLYRATTSELTNMGKSLETAAFQNVLEFQERPAQAVARALNSNAPARALQELANLAERAPSYVDDVTGQKYTPQDVKMGLRNAIMDYAIIHSGGSGLSLRPTALEDILFAQTKGVSSNTKFSLMDFMKRNDMISDEEVDTLQKAIKQMRGVEEAFATGNLDSVLFKNPSPAKAFYAKIIGATAGQKMQEQMNNFLNRFGLGTQGGGIGGGMVAASEGSQVIQNMLINGPESQKVKYLGYLLQHPEEMAPLLRTVKDAADMQDALKAVESGMSGISRQVGRRVPYILREMTDDEYEQQPPPPPEQTLPRLEPVPVPQNQTLPSNTQSGNLVPPVKVPTTDGGALPSPNQQAAAASLRSPTSSGPVDRARFAALFPEDRELLGIGSLMGQ